jgi:hypothetical protein
MRGTARIERIPAAAAESRPRRTSAPPSAAGDQSNTPVSGVRSICAAKPGGSPDSARISRRPPSSTIATEAGLGASRSERELEQERDVTAYVERRAREPLSCLDPRREGCELRAELLLFTRAADDEGDRKGRLCERPACAGRSRPALERADLQQADPVEGNGVQRPDGSRDHARLGILGHHLEIESGPGRDRLGAAFDVSA